MMPQRVDSGQDEYSEFDPGSQQDENQEKNRPGFSDSDIEEMYETQTRFLNFMDQIGELKDTRLRNDVVEHCDRAKISLTLLLQENIPRMIKNRIDKMIKNKRIKKNWSGEDVKILIWIISKYADYKGVSNVEKNMSFQDWKFIASLIPGVAPDGCMFKWLSLKKNNLTEHSWSQRQSALLEKTVKKYGQKDWGLISQKLYFLNTNPHKIYRCAKQCREHWNCYLNPNLRKGPWTKEQDLHLMSIIKNNKCQKKWAEMVGQFKGRTENALKNRYTLIMEKQMKQHPKNNKLTQLQIIEEYLEKSYVQQFVDNPQKSEKSADEGMRTRRRQNKNSKTSVLSPMKVDGKMDNSKEKGNYFDFEKTKSKIQFSDELPNLQQVEVVTLKPDQIGQLTQKILLDKEEYVPCTFQNKKLKRIFRF